MRPPTLALALALALANGLLAPGCGPRRALVADESHRISEVMEPDDGPEDTPAQEGIWLSPGVPLATGGGESSYRLAHSPPRRPRAAKHLGPPRGSRVPRKVGHK